MGWAADQVGAPLVVAIGGLIFAWQLPHIRQTAKPILAARGITLETNVGE